jgi:hypothetical protein
MTTRLRGAALLHPVRCEHLHDTTTRYEPVEKLLTFLLVCPVCSTEKVIETRRYEPRFESHPATGSSGATVHQLPLRRHDERERRAA